MKPKFWLTGAAAVLLMAALITIVWQARTNAALSSRLLQMTAENQKLRKRAVDQERQLVTARAAAQARPESEPAAAAPRPNESPYIQQIDEQGRTIQQLQDKLAQANASINQLDNRVFDLQGQAHQLTEDKQRLASSESDMRDSLGSANRLVEALQKELKAKSDRVVQMEIDEQKLRHQTGVDTKRMDQVTQAISDLQEIHRRQETTLKSILRRYRDVTDQYRSLSGMLESHRGDPGVINTADLSRIQSSIALAEEDLRQFSGLSAQAQLIARKIVAKSP